jgi:hypothetical protein
MNDRLTAKLSMYQQLLACLKKYQPTWQNVPAFAKAVNALETEVEQINRINPGLLADKTGVAVDKAQVKSIMIEEAIRLSGVLQAYAHSIDSRELENSATLVRHDFRTMKELDADDLALHIYQLGQKYLEDLGDFGYEQEDLDNFASYIKSFSEKIGLPRQVRTGNKEMRAAQQTSFEKADAAIQKLMDNLIDSFKKKDPEFWQAYQNARSVMRSGRKTETIVKTETTA